MKFADKVMSGQDVTREELEGLLWDWEMIGAKEEDITLTEFLGVDQLELLYILLEEDHDLMIRNFRLGREQEQQFWEGLGN